FPRRAKERAQPGADVEHAAHADELLDLLEAPDEDRKAGIGAVVAQRTGKRLLVLHFEVTPAEQLLVAAAAGERRVERGGTPEALVDVVGGEAIAQLARGAAGRAVGSHGPR